MFKDIAYLIIEEKTKDEDGFPIIVNTKREIFVNKKSITRSEFYASMQVGIKPTIVLEVRVEDFDTANKVEYEGNTYDIIRTYQKNDNLIELVCG